MKDKYGEVADSALPKPGLEIFWWWYAQDNVEPPACNVWKHDLGKLVYPTVFRDMNFFEELVEAYDLVTHQVFDMDGKVLLKIGREEIREAFGLCPVAAITHEIDFATFWGCFDKLEPESKIRFFLMHVKEVTGVKKSFDAIEGKVHLMENYNDVMVNTHTALYQVLGLKNEHKFGKTSMWMCWDF